MQEEKFLKELNGIMETFYNEVHAHLVKLIQEYTKEENSKSYYSLSGYDAIKKLDDMALLTGWTIDQLNKLDDYVGSPTYKKSLVKKIRKALGYTL